MTCNLQGITYGSVDLSTVPITSKASVKPMYADDGVSIKYFKTSLFIEFVYAVPQSHTDVNGHTSADDYLDDIRDILNTPGLTLSFTYRGLGKNISVTAPDAVYGPYPKVVNWLPLGSNQAVKVSWEVEFATLKCSITPTPEIANYKQYQIVQLVDDMTLGFEEDGSATIQVNGTLEVATPTSLQQLTPNKLKDFLKLYLPNQLTGFNRKIDVTLRKDKRTIDYRITYNEIRSDNALFPYMVTQNVSHQISSSLLNSDPFSGAGFRTWVNDLNGTFQVRPGVWKGWAWIAFLNVMAQRRDRASSTALPNLRNAIDENAKPGTQDADVVRLARKKIRPRQVPLFLSIKEEIFGREVTLSSKWLTYCSLNQLFKSTGMFYPVHNKFVGSTLLEKPAVLEDTPETYSEQWSQWKTPLLGIQNLSGYRDVKLPTYNLIFDTCAVTPDALVASSSQEYHSKKRQDVFVNGVIQNDLDSSWEYREASEASGRVSFDTGASSLISPYLEGLTADNSWIKYDNKFELLEETNATYIPTADVLGSSSLNTNSSDSSYSYRDQTTFKINSNTPPAGVSYDDDVIQTFGKPIYKVRMVGYALRIGYPIPCPTVVGVEVNVGSSSPTTIDAYRVGKQKWVHKLMEASDQVPVYMAMWSQVYAIPSSPQSGEIKFTTSGKPAEFA